jgi:hypothetical protein
MDLLTIVLLVEGNILEASEKNIRANQNEIISMLEKVLPHISRGEITIPHVYELSAHSALIQVDHYLPTATELVNESLLFLVNLSVERGEFCLTHLHKIKSHFLFMLCQAAFLSFPEKISFISYQISYDCARYKDEIISVKIKHRLWYLCNEEPADMYLRSDSTVILKSHVTKDRATWYKPKEFA